MRAWILWKLFRRTRKGRGRVWYVEDFRNQPVITDLGKGA